MTLTSYTIRYNYADSRYGDRRRERQGAYAATRAGREMADLNASLQNSLVQIEGPPVTAEVEEVWFSPTGGYEYRSAA